MKKKAVGIIAIIAILISGGIVMKSIFTGQEIKISNDKPVNEINVKKEEKRMANYLYSNYDGIMKVEFMNFDKNSSAGTWSSDAKVNDQHIVTFSLFGEGGEIEVAEHISKSNGKELRLKNKSNNKNFEFEIIYSQEVKNDN
ncbi:DUF1433 domain-containing protein [Streptococcus iniae]|uniref:hypothetical protein n=1 Tax=Streptococcus iniae TaxID=1346 RepID=UPI0008DB0C4A|nr:hypothetical protein [Streptococcus iniae]OHX27853.1 hypothetical protein BKX95_03430 [Streptococcus iniae]RLV28203.1 DUF1433 domain-containing protein [Streptococcus iniae]